MMNKTTLVYVAVFLAGVVLANRVRSLPMGDKIPSL
jgi:hypothetical protein